MGTPVIECRALTRVYDAGTPVHALAGVDISVDEGEFVAIMGPSGSGKSTFMNILGCLDVPTSGSYTLDGTAVSGLSANELAHVRNHRMGFVFQSFNLLTRTTALENVELPLLYNPSIDRKAIRARALESLAAVGLSDRAGHFPNQLSGGQQQRVAIARAMVNTPSLILADEPTGNLDSSMSGEIMQLLSRLNTQGITVVLVTHEHDIAAYARRTVHFRDGRIVSDTRAGGFSTLGNQFISEGSDIRADFSMQDGSSVNTTEDRS